MSKLQQILTILATMTLREFAEFVRKFGVSNYSMTDILSDIENVPQNPVSWNPTSTLLHSVVLYPSGMNGKFIWTIKLFREHFGLGLRQAKDEMDALRNGTNQDGRRVILQSVPLYICECVVAHWKEQGVDLSIISAMSYGEMSYGEPVPPLAPQYEDDNNNPFF